MNAGISHGVAPLATMMAYCRLRDQEETTYRARYIPPMRVSSTVLLVAIDVSWDFTYYQQ